MKEIFASIYKFLNDRFNLHEDKADEDQIATNIKKEVNFKGTNLWTLIFAIMIASIGLNVNSTAVIIGAMLISPIMGPIMGIGLGTATNDFELMRAGFKNLLVAAGISIITSGIYFYITPLHEVNSELLARTNPSLWDVLIAFFGGLAGIVAGTRKQFSNVIPGVAIATALMPPLCTAGFGIATGNWFFFFGALYLFFINSLFICLATFLIVKNLRFKKHEFESPQREKKVRRIIWTIVTIAVLPSIYLAYRIVQREIFEANAKMYVKNEFNFNRTQVVSKSYKIEGNKKTIELLLVGQEFSAERMDSLRQKMAAYKLNNVTLVIHQGLDAKQEVDVAQIRASILEDVFSREKQPDTLAVTQSNVPARLPNLVDELKVLFPEIENYSLSRPVFNNLKTGKADTVILFTANFNRRISPATKIKLKNWLTTRIDVDSVRCIFE